MPTPEARAAFAEAQLIAAQMGEIHEQELLLEDLKLQTSDEGALSNRDRQLVELRHQWTRLAAQYTQATGRFSQLLEQARRDVLQISKR